MRICMMVSFACDVAEVGQIWTRTAGDIVSVSRIARLADMAGANLLRGFVSRLLILCNDSRCHLVTQSYKVGKCVRLDGAVNGVRQGLELHCQLWLIRRTHGRG